MAGIASLRNIIRQEGRLARAFSSAAGTSATKQTSPPQAAPETKQAASSQSRDEKPVGPGATKGGAYKNPEYYQHNDMTFYDIELEMAKHRLPQPSSQK